MKTTTRNVRRLSLAAAVLALGSLSLASPARAAFITWGSATSTTLPTDVSTNGILIDARNEGTGSPTVNGVTFAATDDLGGTAAGLLGGGATGNTDFNTLLDTVSFGGGTGLSTIDLGTFIPTATYEVQVFYTDQRSGTNDRVMTFGSSTGGSTVDLEPDPNNLTSSPFGQFAIGTFIADGIDPDLTTLPNGFGNSHITALQIRQTVGPVQVPEPSTIALLGITAVGLAVSRRRRKNR